jgi:ComF family protein
VLTYALDALFPRLCVGCERARSALCPACLPAPSEARALPIAGLTVFAAGRYAGRLRRAILAFKRGRRDAGVALAQLLGERVGSLPPSSVLVPVPTTARRRAERGFDQSVLLAHGISLRHDRAMVEALRQRAGDAQRGRSRAARLRAHGRFVGDERAASRIAGATVVLVDDVVTTGATLADCARAVRAAGGAVARALVVAYA